MVSSFGGLSFSLGQISITLKRHFFINSFLLLSSVYRKSITTELVSKVIVLLASFWKGGRGIAEKYSGMRERGVVGSEVREVRVVWVRPNQIAAACRICWILKFHSLETSSIRYVMPSLTLSRPLFPPSKCRIDKNLHIRLVYSFSISEATLRWVGM